MRQRQGPIGSGLVGFTLMAFLLLFPICGAHGDTRGKVLLILPFQPTSDGREEAWIGEGVAEFLSHAYRQLSGLLPLERERVQQRIHVEKQRVNPGDESAAISLGRGLKAEFVIFGHVSRGPSGEVTLRPRYVDLRGGEPESLELIKGAGERLFALYGQLATAYLRVLKVSPKADEAPKYQAALKPTGSLQVYEAFVKARQAFLQGGQERLEVASELLARAVEIDPSFALAHYHLGVTHLALGNRWKATAQFRVSSQVDPSFPEAYKALGDFFMISPRRLYDQAIEAYQRAIAIRPHYADAYVGLGDAKSAKGDHEGAIAEYQRALGYNPFNARVHLSLGKIYYNEKTLYYEAVNAYKKAVDLDPLFLEARMGLGEIYEEKGLYKEAAAEYRGILEVDPRHPGAHYNLALSLEKIDPKAAIAQWERYIELASQIQTEKDWVDIAKKHLKKLQSQTR